MWTAAALAVVVQLALTPSQCLEPCAVTAAVTIAGYEADREVCLVVYDGGIMTDPGRLESVLSPLPADALWLSCWPYSGRKVTDKTIKGIPAGHYTVVVTLTEAAGRPSSHRSLTIVEGLP